MPHKRDGFVPLGDIAGTVELPGDRALTPAAPEARPRCAQALRVTRPARCGTVSTPKTFVLRSPI